MPRRARRRAKHVRRCSWSWNPATTPRDRRRPGQPLSSAATAVHARPSAGPVPACCGTMRSIGRPRAPCRRSSSTPTDEGECPMAVVSPDQYAEMIDRAKAGKFAYPPVNVSSAQTATAALPGFAEAGSHGITQVSFGGAEHPSGSTIKDRVAGSIALAEYVHAVAKNYPINVALHTDHCAEEVLPTWVEPLIEWDLENRVKKGLDPLFQSHMWDGSAVPVDENLEIAERLLEKSVEAKKILEIEVGVVGGEEDGVAADVPNEKLFSTPEDGLKTAAKLGL